MQSAEMQTQKSHNLMVFSYKMQPPPHPMGASQEKCPPFEYDLSGMFPFSVFSKPYHRILDLFFQTLSSDSGFVEVFFEETV